MHIFIPGVLKINWHWKFANLANIWALENDEEERFSGYSQNVHTQVVNAVLFSLGHIF